MKLSGDILDQITKESLVFHYNGVLEELKNLKPTHKKEDISYLVQKKYAFEYVLNYYGFVV